MVGRFLNDSKISSKNGIYYINCIKLLESNEAPILRRMINIVIKKSYDLYNNRYNND